MKLCIGMYNSYYISENMKIYCKKKFTTLVGTDLVGQDSAQHTLPLVHTVGNLPLERILNLKLQKNPVNFLSHLRSKLRNVDYGTLEHIRELNKLQPKY